MAPALTLRVLAMSLARSGSTFESSQLDEIQDGLSRSSRCEIQNSVAMLEVCWDRHVVVHNQPDAIESAQAHRPTQPQVGDVTASQRGVHVVEAMNEGQLAVGRDVQVVYLVGEGASKCSEGFLPGSTFIVSPEVSQGPEVRSDIERNEVGCIEGHDAVDVLRVKRLHRVLYALSNEGFGFSHGLLLSRKGGTRVSPAALRNRVSVMAFSLLQGLHHWRSSPKRFLESCGAAPAAVKATAHRGVGAHGPGWRASSAVGVISR